MERDDEQTLGGHDDEPGAEREESEAADALPGRPADHEAPAGDTDQHSGSNA